MKPATRFLLLAGAIGVGFLLFRANPREVTLVYSGEDLDTVDVVILREGRLVRRAELRAAGSGQVTHRVRLPDGDYLLQLDLRGARAPRHVERGITVTESGPIVIPLGP